MVINLKIIFNIFFALAELYIIVNELKETIIEICFVLVLLLLHQPKRKMRQKHNYRL